MDTTRNHLAYFLKRAFCRHPLFHDLYYYSVLASEAVSRRPEEDLRCETTGFANSNGLPRLRLRFILPSAYQARSFRGLRFSLVDFNEKTVKSWCVRSPKTARTMQLFREYVPSHKAAYLKIKMPFMGSALPHCCSFSTRGYLCASNSFYNHIIDTNRNALTVIPQHYLDTVPMCYSKQGGISSDGRYWYFVRWPLTDWADVIDGKEDSVRCQIGRIGLEEKSEDVLMDMRYPEEVHEIASSPNDRHLIFCTFKQELNVPYPNKSYFSATDGYRLSHQGGVKLQKLVTFDLRSLKYWFTEIPAPAVGHCAFDLDDPNVFYVSAHNLVYHHLSVFLEGRATIVKLRISEGRTVVERQFSDEGFLRIFQHEVFRYRGECCIAIMSFSNELYVLRASDLSLLRRVRMGAPNRVDFSRTGIVLCDGRAEAGYSVNASEDGRHLAIGSPRKFVIYDMDEDRITSLEKVLPEFMVIGSGLPHTRTCQVQN